MALSDDHRKVEVPVVTISQCPARLRQAAREDWAGLVVLRDADSRSKQRHTRQSSGRALRMAHGGDDGGRWS